MSSMNTWLGDSHCALGTSTKFRHRYDSVNLIVPPTKNKASTARDLERWGVSEPLKSNSMFAAGAAMAVPRGWPVFIPRH